MNKKSQNAGGTVALAALAVLGLGTAAMAADYPGSLVTFTNGPRDTQSLFTFNGSTITATGDTSGVNTYYLTFPQSADKVQLVGFRSIYLVKSDGSVTSGVSTTGFVGFVQDGTTTTKTYYDGTPSLGGFTGYDDASSGKGYPDGSHFMVIANPTLAVKSASNNDTFGSFSFNEPIGNYYIGLDYILKGVNGVNGGTGATGRAYFAVPAALPPAPAVPEPGSLVSMALGSLGLAGLMLRARKRQTPQTA